MTTNASPLRYILGIDPQGLLSISVQAALHGTGIKYLQVEDFVAAKRRMIQSPPVLILSFVDVGGNQEAGFRFCQEIKGHASFESLPVILLCLELTHELPQKASSSGAKGVLLWPQTPDALQARLQLAVPEIFPAETRKDVAIPVAVPAPANIAAGKPSVVTPPAAAKKEESPAPTADPTHAEKLRLAQNLLAKVLHNLKTSDLLQVADPEDVPRVVYEITRSVCGIRSGAESRQSAARPAAKETHVDLGSIFNLKS